MMKSVLFVLGLVGVCFALAPPAVPSTFYGEVRMQMHKDGRNWLGGGKLCISRFYLFIYMQCKGIYALDIANTRSILDVRMIPHNGEGKEWLKIRQINRDVCILFLHLSLKNIYNMEKRKK